MHVLEGDDQLRLRLGAHGTVRGVGEEGLSLATISRLKQGWEAEYGDFQTRDWHGHEIVYLCANGIYINVRAYERRCVLVRIGCDTQRRMHFLAIEVGSHESAESWKALVLSLRDRGLQVPPKLVVSDGALGFRKALGSIPRPAPSATGCTGPETC